MSLLITIILWAIGIYALICAFAYAAGKVEEKRRVMTPEQAKAASRRFQEGEAQLQREWEAKRAEVEARRAAHKADMMARPYYVPGRDD